ncbi:helix-turn-helix domain-containing protein [Streptomyces sp. URMC 129]|uniref:helix-turn-helix domain-containing protein n=1 Tax=Streptomyces sp. URMC 129 TaxID=3423407 RepID=UPI003F1CEFB3
MADQTPGARRTGRSTPGGLKRQDKRAPGPPSAALGLFDARGPATDAESGEIMQYADDEPLTVPEVMSYLRLSRSQVYELIRTEQLRSVKLGASRRVLAGEVHAYLTRVAEAV